MATKARKKAPAAPAPVASPDVGTLLSAALLNALSGAGTAGATDSLSSAVAAGSVQLDESGFPIVEFNAKGGKIIVTLVLGMRQRMMYTLALWDEQGNNKFSREGVSWDNDPDIQEIDPQDALENDHLFWDVKITQSVSGPGDFYYFALKVEQDGTALCPLFENFGPLSGTEIISGSLVFKA
jgi:hypothetical protein